MKSKIRALGYGFELQSPAPAFLCKFPLSGLSRFDFGFMLSQSR
jgi:hypothetical protein